MTRLLSWASRNRWCLIVGLACIAAIPLVSWLFDWNGTAVTAGGVLGAAMAIAMRFALDYEPPNLPDIPNDYMDFIAMETEAYGLTGDSPVQNVEVHSDGSGVVETTIYFESDGHSCFFRWLWHPSTGEPIKTAYTKFAEKNAKKTDWPFVSERKAQ